MQTMGIEPVAQGLVEHQESIDVIGDVTCWVRDLHEAWETENHRQRHEVTRDAAVVVIDFEIAFGVDGEVDEAVAREEVEHVVEEADAGLGGGLAGAVEVHGDADAGFPGLAGDFGGAGVGHGRREVRIQ
jgi:hypothetical protein